ncbi:MAG: PAS domain-containing protein [Caldilineaceae bacterium]|nr:PAS domain-containing protein [Caldilineaceae bacterium]
MQTDLRAALFRALEDEKSTLTRPVPVRFNGAPHPVALLVRPAKAPGQALVFFLEDETPMTTEQDLSEKLSESALVQQLQAELGQAQQQHQTLREEYETTVEELRSANEELQSTNEEYRSTLEELETSKEELQSINEELQAVNLELRNKVEETSQAHNDLQNLFIATEIATLFLNRELKIKRYTPRAADLFNLIPTDQGRPVGHLRTNLHYAELEADARQVLANLIPMMREIQNEEGASFQVGVRPYRTRNDYIDGVVITFVDISINKQNELALRASEEALRHLNETLESQVKERTQQVRDLVTQLALSEQEERQRISNVLHDDLQQRLYSIQLQLTLLQDSIDPENEAPLQWAAEMAEELQASIDLTRSLSVDLSPPLLKGEGLEAAIGWLAGQMERQHQLRVVVQAPNDLPAPPTDLRVLFFQVVREALFNIVKHAAVREATVILRNLDNHLQVEVIDRGPGFDVDAVLHEPGRSHGLLHNQQRLELVGGQMEIVSAPGSGTRVVLTCPLSRRVIRSQ